MRILAINASHRGDKGLTRRLIDRLFAGAVSAGAACEVATLARLKINSCLSCYRCQDEEPHLECVYREKDDVQALFAQMGRADLLVYATPIYLMNMTGLLKTFLDRTYASMDIGQLRLSNGLIHHHIDPAISSKPFVTLIVCSNLEDETWRNVAAYFRTYARFMETRQVGLLVRNAAPLFELNDPRQRRPFEKRIQAALAGFEQAGRELAARGRIGRAAQRQASQEIVPLPFFALLKRFRPVRQMIIRYLEKTGQ